jgi:hypothetical protein
VRYLFVKRVEISDGAVIKWNYELSVNIVNKSNIQSKTPSRVTHSRDNIFIFTLVDHRGSAGDRKRAHLEPGMGSGELLLALASIVNLGLGPVWTSTYFEVVTALKRRGVCLLLVIAPLLGMTVGGSDVPVNE